VRLLPPLPRRRGDRCRARPERVPLRGGVGSPRAGARARVDGRPRPLLGRSRLLPRPRRDAGRHAAPLHEPALADPRRRLAIGRHAGSLRGLREPRHATPRRSRPVGVHDQRGKHAPPTHRERPPERRADRRDEHALADAAPAFGVAPDDFGVFFLTVDDTFIRVIAEAHRQAGAAVHSERSDAKVGITLSLQQAAAEPGGEKQAEAFDEPINRRFLREMGTVGDFVGVQNYTRLRFGPGSGSTATRAVSACSASTGPRSGARSGRARRCSEASQERTRSHHHEHRADAARPAQSWRPP
jgi:hypothetical protein